ncbi:MAG: C40 family peptidase [Draconibacterium sp.]|nr:C40 family peptidase [Draconibacterium sp.]
MLANQLMGRPYLWGGTSARAMDCSGFVKTLYFMNGVILARDASLQIKQGEKVEVENDFSNLQTGDLLFFGQKKSDDQPEKITHVAFSLGNTEYIHASGKIERNSFERNSAIYSEYRKNSFVGTKDNRI